MASFGPAGARTFAWLHPAPAPRGWRQTRLATGAVLAYPPGWRVERGDRGTASAVQPDSRGGDAGYLNLTPRQSAESVATWPTFRVHHNEEEDERDVTRLAAAAGLRFLDGSGSCVSDAYTTSTDARYVEIACLVRGRRASTVIVGAALQGTWARERAAIERAIAAMRT